MSKEKGRYIGLIGGIGFWAGFGLSSIINVIKTVYTQSTLSYDWVMFAVSIVLITVGSIYLARTRKNQAGS